MQDVAVMLLSFPGQGEGGSLPSEAGRSYSREDWQEGHRGRLQASSYNPEGVDDHVNLTCVRASAPGWGAVFCCREDQSLGR